MSDTDQKYRKIAALYFETPLTAEESEELLRMARSFPEKIPGCLDIIAGMDDKSVGSIFALAITFASAEDFENYRVHPTHVEFSQFTHGHGVNIRSAGYMF